VFFELKLCNMTMQEYEKNFLELLRYVNLIKEEKVKIQHFLSGLPTYYKDNIYYDEPKNLEEAIRKAHYLYEQSKRRVDMRESWKGKVKDNKIRGRRGINLL